MTGRASQHQGKRRVLWRNFLGSVLIVLSILFPARGALNMQVPSMFWAVGTLVSVGVLLQRPIPMTRWYIAVVAMGTLSLGWSVSVGATTQALLGFSVVSLTALAGGALMTVRWLVAALMTAFFTSAWVLNSAKAPLGMFDPASVYNINTYSKLVLMGCLSLAGLLWGSSRRRQVAAIIAIMVYIPTLLASGSTQAIYGWFLGASVYLFWVPGMRVARRQPAVAWMALLALILSLGFLLWNIQSWWSRSGLVDISQSGRSAIWARLLEGCDIVSCGIGRGFGTILAVSEQVMFAPTQAHNLFLVFLLELGVVGLVLAGTLGFLVLKWVGGEASPILPALVLPGLAWAVSSDLINAGDSFVISTWLAIAAHVTTTNGASRGCEES